MYGLEILRAKVEAGIAYAKENNITIIYGSAGDREKCYGCALAIAYWADGGLLNNPNVFNISSRFEKYDMVTDHILSFVEGFDGLPYHPDDEFNQLGLAYRSKLNPVKLPE